ncbi:GNAT family N-acetyltransferase [Macrococcoides caseolyticum]|uniref:GNAT family N-acetyltransferase n=1 Tax=Macrococcoides caseolyticum TaxID=69966 RepID=UPI001F240FEB|nr:GNAT family N-acetyltransferase [Macrococcus caseolyticus]MCE4957569.1 GNAT family N-acetyltransferase [Macrococcus caseolyticus]
MEFIGTQIKIVQYKEEYRAQLEAFELTERQMIYSSLPLEVLDEGLFDPNRRPCIVLNHDDEVVGFFVLHQHYQHEGYDTPVNAVYVRSLSINNKLQGQGYGTEIMMNIPEFAQSVFPDFDHLFLVVDAENQGAWNLYERAGFMHLATNPNGPIGKERLYYLDLDAKYVSKLRLVLEGDIVRLLKDEDEVGTVELAVNDKVAVLKAMNILEDVETIRENVLRQIATFVRKHYQDVVQIEADVPEDLMDVYLNNNFVAMDVERPHYLTKLIRY